MRRKTLEKMEKLQLILLSVFIVILLAFGAMMVIKGKEVVEVLGTLEDRVTAIEMNLTEQADNEDVTMEDSNTKKYVEILSPEHNAKLDLEPLVFTGKVSPNATKIVVNALVIDDQGVTNNAVYTLQDFELGDETFSYTSKTEWGNLVEGINTYTFTVYFADGSEESESVTVYFTKPSEAIL